MQLLRQASWREVLHQFHGVEPNAVRQANGWASRYGIKPDEWSRRAVNLEGWGHDELARVLREMAEVEPRLLVEMVGDTNNATLPPRVDGLPIVLIRFGFRYGIIDGKHRINRWSQWPGTYAVLVVEAKC